MFRILIGCAVPKYLCQDPELLDLCQKYGDGVYPPRHTRTHTPTRTFISVSLAMPLRDMEKGVILAALREYDFDRLKTAETLGIGLRTLQRKLSGYKAEERLRSRRRLRKT